jgi:hypothetical protein
MKISPDEKRKILANNNDFFTAIAINKSKRSRQQQCTRRN